MKTIAFIALGSNLGNSREIIAQAVGELQQLSDFPLLKSSLWQTTPVDCPPGSPSFVNAVVGLVPMSGETPASLLLKLQSLEKAFGRQQKIILNEPRPLDLDIVTFGNIKQSSDTLKIPHPRAHLRRFVLQPLREIAPDLILESGRSVAEILDQLVTDEGTTQLGPI